MIIYGVCAGPSRKFADIARPSLERVLRNEDEIRVLFGQRSIFEAYNRFVLDARAVEDLEGLVLIHDDVEIVDVDIVAKLRSVFADDRVAVVGVIGASGVRSLEWWRYRTSGGVREDRLGEIDFGRGECEVDMVDGLFLGLSPWAVRNLAFDEQSYDGFHGYDGDICLSAKANGRKVMVADIDVVHHTEGGYGDRASFDAADEVFRWKWNLSAGAVKRLRQQVHGLWR